MDVKEEKITNTSSSKVQKKSEKDKNGMIGGLVFGTIILPLIYLIYHNFSEFPIGRIICFILALIVFFFYAIAVSCYFDYKESKRIERLTEEALQEEIEFSEIALDKRALRAEKLFRMNQKELMRYYDMNLAQTKFLSGLGIVMIIFGVLIVIASIFLYISTDTDTTLLLVGSLSGIVVDFIGALFIKMYTKNIEAAIQFHTVFAESNNLLLANSIAHKIDDCKIREETLSDISKSIVTVKNRG